MPTSAIINACQNPAVVIDNGTGYTKVGYAGASQPEEIFPTAITKGWSNNGGVLDELKFSIGDFSTARHKLDFPIRHGLVEDWDAMERLWQRCFYEKVGI